jgi:hypothetical protein
LIQQGFKPSRRSIEEEGFDSVGHISFYHSTQTSAFSLQQETLTAADAKAARSRSQSQSALCALCGESIFVFLRVSVVRFGLTIYPVEHSWIPLP